MKLSAANLLVFHGSRDPRSLELSSQLVRLLQKHFIFNHLSDLDPFISIQETKSNLESISTITQKNELPLIEIAALELATLSLEQRIISLALKAKNRGYKTINVFPLFLSPGVHVCQDIPHEIKLARQKLGTKININLMPYLGSYREIRYILLQKFIPSESKIIVAHGSRLDGGNKLLETIASEIGAICSYFSISPSLTETIESQIKNNCSTISIVPYFLFPGKISDKIAQQVDRLQFQYPQTNLHLAQPLGVTTELVKLIATHLNK